MKQFLAFSEQVLINFKSWLCINIGNASMVNLSLQRLFQEAGSNILPETKGQVSCPPPVVLSVLVWIISHGLFVVYLIRCNWIDSHNQFFTVIVEIMKRQASCIFGLVWYVKPVQLKTPTKVVVLGRQCERGSPVISLIWCFLTKALIVTASITHP